MTRTLTPAPKPHHDPPTTRPPPFALPGYALMLEVDGMGDLMDAVAMHAFGITPNKHFDKPWLVSQQGAGVGGRGAMACCANAPQANGSW